jgi:hypothetical protein
MMLRRIIMGKLGTNTRVLVARLLLIAALAITAAGCGDDDGDAGAPATTPPATTGASTDQGWKRVVPGGDCRCSDGSKFSFWVREANPKKVIFYLQGGGACFSAKTCAPDSHLYQTRVNEGPAGEGGIFDFANERNPFADYSVVYVPYCTADVHIGNVTTQYAPGVMTVRSSLNVPVKRSLARVIVHTSAPWLSPKLASYAAGPSLPKYCVT